MAGFWGNLVNKQTQGRLGPYAVYKGKQTKSAAPLTIAQINARLPSSYASNASQGNTYQTQAQQLSDALSRLPAPAGGDSANPYYTSSSGGSSGGRRSGGGGGGGGGVNKAKIRAQADQLFKLNTQPYDQMRAGLMGEGIQANAYNPNFGAMASQYTTAAQNAEKARQAEVQQMMAQTNKLGGQLANQNATAMAGAFGDIQRSGGSVDPYMQRAMTLGSGVTGNLANQQSYANQLNQSAAGGLADALRTSGLITQGAQANLANNRGTLINQLTQQTAAVGAQQAQAQQSLDQAKLEFLLKYGVQ